VPEVEDVLQMVSGKGPQKLNLDEESILYEEPKLDESDNAENEITKKPELDAYEQIAVLGMIKNLQKSLPNDEILQEQV
jgi:hypothetical protein